MAVTSQRQLLMMIFWPPHLIFLALLFFMPFSCSQSFSFPPQNLETFYPFPTPPPSPSPSPSPSPTLPPNGTVYPPPLVSPPPGQVLVVKRSNNGRVAKAVAATAASTLVAATLLFFLIQRYLLARRRKRQVVADDSAGISGTGNPANSYSAAVGTNDRFSRVGSDIKGVIVDENGLDVVYWRRLEEGGKGRFQKEALPPSPKEEEEDEVNTRNSRRKKPEPVQEVPLLRGKSSTSHVNVEQEIQEQETSIASSSSTGSVFSFHVLEKPSLSSQTSNTLPPPSQPIIKPPPSPPVPPPPEPPFMAVSKRQGPTVPPPPPAPAIPAKKSPSPGPPRPPPPTSSKKISPGPPPPPPPRAGGSATSSKLPAVSKGKQLDAAEAGKSSRAEGEGSGNNGQVKLKPLHWDKVNKNTDHSMVWDKLEGGSFRFDDDLMEALFGYVATNRKSPRRESGSSTPKNSSPPSPIVILHPRKSQNTAIVIKSLAISRKEVLDALTDGHGLDIETLEKLIRIAPTKEEESQILEFRGDPMKLADADSFLYHLLKAFPSAFSRFNAMLFRSTYDTEVRQFKEYLETLDLGCKELRNRGLFMKLLEAILKAGNRMNAGTSRGNAQAFKLSSLKKLSDVKSTDGRTTLLHFVVEEVVWSEGKKLVLHRNRSINRTSSRSSSSSSTISESSALKEERHREYKMLGLPVVGGLSSEFSNVKKAAEIDYDAFAGTCSALTARVREIKLLVSKSAINGDGGGGFVKEMKGFLEAAEVELNGLKEEQKRVMELVKRTTDYYQPGASNDPGAHQLQLFVIIKDFLGMVDQVCVDIARSLRQKKTRESSSSGSSPKSPASKKSVRFPNLPAHFLEERSRSSSSESDRELRE